MDQHEVDMSDPITDSPSRLTNNKEHNLTESHPGGMNEIAEADSEFERTNQFAQYDFA